MFALNVTRVRNRAAATLAGRRRTRCEAGPGARAWSRGVCGTGMAAVIPGCKELRCRGDRAELQHGTPVSLLRSPRHPDADRG